MAKRLAHWLRRMADRLDWAGAPKALHWSFTFEPDEGIRFREDGKGCRLWYLSNDDYDRAHRDGGYPKPPPFQPNRSLITYIEAGQR